MDKTIIKTKLFIPQSRPQLISRDRLIDKISYSLHGKMTMISAPAGFGKTTLVTDWIKQNKTKTAWFSIDENDNNPKRFIKYLISSIQTIDDSIGSNALETLEENHEIDTESVITLLINDITLSSESIVLVLDDYHLIDNKEINEAVLFLINNMPSQFHIIMTTREDPIFPLAKFRSVKLSF